MSTFSQGAEGNAIKITVLGKGVTGKTSLSYKYLKFKNSGGYEQTVEERYSSKINVDGVDYDLEILDTAGQEDFQNLIDTWIQFGDGYIIVFAVNDQESFEIAKEKRQRILKTKKGDKNPLIILVGNKIDLVNDRKISYEDGKALADSWGCEYIETSAKTGERCNEPFEKMANRIVIKKKEPKKGSGCCLII